MKRTAMLLAMAFAFSSVAMAKPLTKTITTTTTSTEGGVPTTHIHQSDGPAVGDPGGSGVSSRADQGPANTQKYCEDGSTDPDCVRAEKRQLSPTTWQEDCASGATKACPK